METALSPRTNTHASRIERLSLPMLFIVIGLLVILALAGLVTVFVAFPHRGEHIPHAEWLSDAMMKARNKIRQ